MPPEYHKLFKKPQSNLLKFIYYFYSSACHTSLQASFSLRKLKCHHTQKVYSFRSFPRAAATEADEDKLWRTTPIEKIHSTGSFWPNFLDLILNVRCWVLQVYTKMAFFHFTPVGPERIGSVTTWGGRVYLNACTSAHPHYLSAKLLNR